DLIKNSAMFLALPVSYICHLSLQQGTIPDIWKEANIKPLKKPNGEYRPISLLCTLSKVLEKLVAKVWITPLLGNKFNKHQFAFTPSGNCGTTNALTFITNWLLQRTDPVGSSARLITLDFKKAFDKISHNVIINSLHKDFSCTPELL